MALCGAWAWATPDAEGAFRLRVGPFFEYGSREGRGMTRLAVRPFFAWEEDRRNPPDRDMEVVWPLSHFGWRGDAFHWRVVMTFWNDEDRTDRLTRDYSLAIPPLWVNGRDGEDAYWGLFPIWGRMPKFLLLEDFRWRFFPVWLSYRTGGTQGVGRTYVLWPFFSLKHDDDAARWGLWPLYGTKRERERDSRYVLWPFWNDQTFHAPNHNGGAWMLWPLAERIDADTEQGWGLLPPLFRWSETTDGAFLLRCPWPLFERYRDRRESTWRAWRFWGMTHRGTRDGWWFLNTGVPHYVEFVDDVEAVDVCARGRRIRYDLDRFPQGTNVNFVQPLGPGVLRMRTYERGVENETLACGTGATAAAIVTSYTQQSDTTRFRVLVPGGELTIRFAHEPSTATYTDVRLSGPARRVFEGTFDSENF